MLHDNSTYCQADFSIQLFWYQWLQQLKSPDFNLLFVREGHVAAFVKSHITSKSSLCSLVNSKEVCFCNSSTVNIAAMIVSHDVWKRLQKEITVMHFLLCCLMFMFIEQGYGKLSFHPSFSHLDVMESADKSVFQGHIQNFPGKCKGA